MSGTIEHTSPHEAADVTDEMLTMAESIYDGWFADGNGIDWEDFLYRMDGSTLADGTTLDLGPVLNSPAIKKIKRYIQSYSAL